MQGVLELKSRWSWKPRFFSLHSKQKGVLEYSANSGSGRLGRVRGVGASPSGFLARGPGIVPVQRVL